MTCFVVFSRTSGEVLRCGSVDAADVVRQAQTADEAVVEWHAPVDVRTQMFDPATGAFVPKPPRTAAPRRPSLREGIVDPRAWGAWFGHEPNIGAPVDISDALQAAIDYVATPSAFSGWQHGGLVQLPRGYGFFTKPIWIKPGVRVVGPGIAAGGLVWAGGDEVEFPIWIGSKDQTAAFDCGLFDLTIKSLQDPLTTSPGRCLVYTNSAQHTGGLARVKIEGGARTQFRAEIGWGGASYITFADVETHSLAGLDGAPDNPQIEIDYGPAFIEARNIVVQGSSSRPDGTPMPPVARGLVVKAGYVAINGFHAEQVRDAIVDAIRLNTPHHLIVRNATGGNGVDCLVRQSAGVLFGHLIIGQAKKNGARCIYADGLGTEVTADIFADRVF